MILLCVSLNDGDELWISKMIFYQFTINEMFVCIAVMFHYWFSEFVDNFILRQNIGIAFIAIILLCVLLNIGFIVQQVYQAVKNKLRLRRERMEQIRFR